jgi:hypothetical protein
MALITGNPNFPTQSQVPDNSILDLNGKQIYLGNSYTASSGLLTVNPSVETTMLYLVNPATSKKSLFCYRQELSSAATSGIAVGRSYTNPSISANGAAALTNNLRPASTSSSVSNAYIMPTPATQTQQVSTITTVADVSGSLNNKYFFLYGFNGTTGGVDSFYVWFNINSAGTDPLIPFSTGIQVDAATDASANAIATALASAINSEGDFNAPAPGANIVTSTVVAYGTLPPTTDSSGSTKTNFTFGNTIGNNKFGNLISLFTTTTMTTTSNNLVILDPGNSLLVTSFSTSGNGPVSTTIYWYEI